MSTCGRQNNDPRRHSCPTSLNPGNVVKGILADATVGNTEREAGQKRGRQTDALGTGLCPAQLAAKTGEEPMSQEMWAPQG